MINVFDIKNNILAQVDLPSAVKDVVLKDSVINQVLHTYLNNARQNTSSTKGISEISGTTKKPWKQKGTGRARTGSLRTPQMRGGAIIFGPKPGGSRLKCNKKQRKLALLMLLKDITENYRLIVLDTIEPISQKTSDLVDFKNKFNINESCLFVVNPQDQMYSARNIPNVSVCTVNGLSVYNLLKYDVFVFTQDSLKEFLERLSK